MPKRSQLSLDLPSQYGWGGERAGAGRRPTGAEPRISHRRKLDVDGRSPVHVTLRARHHVWNLRSRRCHRIIAEALRGVLARADFRVVHFSILGNHLHLVAEADSARSLANGMRALTGRITLGLNALMGRRGAVFEDRYHAHVLDTPAEVRNGIAYVHGNFASHAFRRGERMSPAYADPYSSAVELGPDGLPPPVSEPRTWLLRCRGEVAREPEAEYAVAA